MYWLLEKCLCKKLVQRLRKYSYGFAPFIQKSVPYKVRLFDNFDNSGSHPDPLSDGRSCAKDLSAKDLKQRE